MILERVRIYLARRRRRPQTDSTDQRVAASLQRAEAIVREQQRRAAHVNAIRDRIIVPGGGEP